MIELLKWACVLSFLCQSGHKRILGIFAQVLARTEGPAFLWHERSTFQSSCMPIVLWIHILILYSTANGVAC